MLLACISILTESDLRLSPYLSVELGLLRPLLRFGDFCSGFLRLNLVGGIGRRL